MANERHKRLMQEALDETLEQDARQELFREVDADPESAETYGRLRQVDRLLRGAPFERAPQTLALSIMARLAEGLKQQPLSHLSGLALAMALTLVMLVVVPLLVGAVMLFLGAVGSASALTGLMNMLMRLMSLVVAGIDTLIDGAKDLIAAHPETPALMLSIVPVMMFWVARSSVFRRTDKPDPS